MHVLVTGAAGFIGSHLSEKVAEEGASVRAVDCFLSDSYPSSVKQQVWHEVGRNPGVELVELDLREEFPGSLLDGIDVVVNEAAMPGLMASWRQFPVYSTCNVHVVEQLARECTRRGVHLIQISTSSVYGQDAIGDEESPLRPTSPYGVTKLAAEELVRAFARSRGLEYTILRYFSVYGPRQRPDMAYRRIIDAMLEDREVEIYGDGRQTRSNTYVADCVSATIQAIVRRPSRETINIAGPDHASLLTAIGCLEKAMGRQARLVHRPARPGDQRHTRGSIVKAQQLLDYQPSTSLEEGLEAQAAWQRRIVCPSAVNGIDGSRED